MPNVDYAFLCDHGRSEAGVAHAIAIGIDTISARSTPTVARFGVVFRVGFSRNECGRPHRMEVIVETAAGEPLVKNVGTIQPEWGDPTRPPDWTIGLLAAMNLQLELKDFGLYQVVIMVDDAQGPTIPFRCVAIEPKRETGSD